MDAESDVRSAEVRKLEAERLKLEFESKEIERRLRERWWQGARFPQYLVAIVITAALLFGWARAYLEPILRREAELNALTERRNATLNALLEAKNERLSVESSQLSIERDKLKEQADRLSREAKTLKEEQQTLKEGLGRLTTESRTLKRGMDELTMQRDQLDNKRQALERQQQSLKTVVTGLRIAIDQVEKGGTKFFSIHNRADPINKLKDSYGWNLWSDNYYGRLGYYLVITHPSVREGKQVFVGREFELDRLKKDLGSGWKKYVAQVSENSPLLALDYSYLGLLADERAPVGGTLYKKGGEAIDFHAPLSEWAKDLRAALEKD
jgi:hypothetical protein